LLTLHISASFGAYPRFIRNIYHELHARVEEAPDLFIRNTSPQLLVESRQAVSQLLNASLNEVVFVPNATTAINTVLRNLEFADGDVIVYFDSIYDACEKTIDHVCEMNNGKVAKRVVNAVYPIEDNDLVDLFRTAIRDEKEKGKRPVLAIFDTIACFPAVRMPFEHLVAVAKEGGVLSLIDGAHGVGQIHIDLARLQPDFFVSNLHK
jgi:selenocysteine lyase/cysteine desulfurase